MLSPPPVIGTRRPVHRPLDKAVEGRPLCAGTIAPPPVLLVDGHLVVERVVDGDGGSCGRVDPVHVLVELGAVSVSVPIILSDEKHENIQSKFEI